MWSFILITGIIFYIYSLLKAHYKFWANKGVLQGSPIPLFGESFGITFRTQSFAEMVSMVYNMFPNTRYSGFYQFLTPTLAIRDPDLIKQITVKDFDSFLDHRIVFSEKIDPLWANNLFALCGKKWKDVRSAVSPAFTSSKMKFMFSLMMKSGEQFSQFFLEKNEDVIVIEMKDSFTKFTNDVIANVVFGVECDSLKDPQNEFYTMGKDISNFNSFWKNLKFLGFLFMPKLLQFFRIRLFDKKVGEFFTNVVTSNIESREKHGIVRPDMINVLMEAKKYDLKYEDSKDVDTGFATVEESEMGKNKKHTYQITDRDIVSQALVFFFAGFDAVSYLMCFMSYELALNPHIQAKLINEVDETKRASQGQITYEALLGMKYLDMVLSESLRKWPNAIISDRICTKPYTIAPKHPHETPLHLAKDTVITFPIFGIHRDPQYYPEPEKFDPERFSDENRRNIQPYTYLPFGSGPRNCIASRFALLETKIIFFCILEHFEIVPTKKTDIPIQLATTTINMTAKNGFWLGLKRRCNK